MRSLTKLDLSGDNGMGFGACGPMSIRALPEGISKLVNLDDASQQGIVEILLPASKYKSMEVLPETSFDHPFFGILRKLDFTAWRMATLPKGQFIFIH